MSNFMEIWNHVTILLAWKCLIFFANYFPKLLLNCKIEDFGNLNCFSFGIMCPMSIEILCRCTYTHQYAILLQRSYNFPYRIGAQNHTQLSIVLQFICDKYSKWPARSVFISFGCDNRTTSQKIAITQIGHEEILPACANNLSHLFYIRKKMILFGVLNEVLLLSLFSYCAVV